MTSKQSDETAQHVYHRLGYVDLRALPIPEKLLEIIALVSLRAILFQHRINPFPLLFGKLHFVYHADIIKNLGRPGGAD